MSPKAEGGPNKRLHPAASALGSQVSSGFNLAPAAGEAQRSER